MTWEQIARRGGAVVLGLTLVLVTAGCTGGGGRSTSTPSAAPTVPVDSTAAFQQFSGLSVPSSADQVSVRATLDTTGQPAYRVRFSLPSSQLDAFCATGQMSRPLRVITIPQSVRTTFAYTGDSSTGVAIGEAGLPSDQRVQRQVFAVGTKTATADVQVYAYKMPS